MIRTRQWIMDNFMALAQEKPLNKITVAQIVGRCGLNRNTFYYYFEDIPSLVEAIFAQQAAALLPEQRDTLSLLDSLDQALAWCQKYRQAALHIYHSASRELFQQHLTDLIGNTLDAYARQAGLDGKYEPEALKTVLHFYRCLLLGVTLDWLDHDMRYDLKEEARSLITRAENGALLPSEYSGKQP